MDKLLDKIFFRSKNLDYISQNIKKITQETSAYKIFQAINNFNETSEVRYVGGCIRKIIKKEQVDDIDLATNLIPSEVCDALKKNNINFYETGIDHGTITAIIGDQKYEITSLRKDVSTDGRHAKVQYSLDWKEDSNRRDFSINAIYSDKDGNLFDPHYGKKDLESGTVKFIGNPEERIQEDYLRILRYLRFFLNYSNNKHELEIFRTIKRNIGGISKLSSERLIEELKKLTKSDGFIKLFKDKESLELIEIIFPQLKNLQSFKKLNAYAQKNLSKIDFILLISLLIIDGTDNADYFLYKFKISNKDQKRIKFIDKVSKGFIYMVSSAATTGAQNEFSNLQEEYFKRISKLNLNNKLMVGFGISNSKTYKSAISFSDGAIIGSAFIKYIEDNGIDSIKNFIKKITN